MLVLLHAIAYACLALAILKLWFRLQRLERLTLAQIVVKAEPVEPDQWIATLKGPKGKQETMLLKGKTESDAIRPLVLNGRFADIVLLQKRS